MSVCGLRWTCAGAGTGVFSAQQVITTEAIGAYSVFAADVDGDGDLDVLCASFNDDKIAWYRNNGERTVCEQWRAVVGSGCGVL